MSGNKGTVVITGASNGFGRALAEDFIADGWRTFATLRDANGKNAKSAGELRALGAEVVELDVTSDASVDAAALAIHKAAGDVDVVVNNAGNSYMGLTEAFTPAEVEGQFSTNVIGPVRVNRAFLPAMRERRKGLIVHVSSVVGRSVIPFMGLYASSKWALEALAEATSYEVRPFGVDIAIVEPGAYGTNIGNSRTEPADQARVASYGAVAKYIGNVAKGLAASAEGRSANEVAQAIVNLANAPAGTRPLRTLVGGMPQVAEINEHAAPLQRSIIENFGLGEMLAPEHATA
jgi:NAD(P)-dependent dehydrogenase (short-subunit alcohol dehydrogenase family)